VAAVLELAKLYHNPGPPDASMDFAGEFEELAARKPVEQIVDHGLDAATHAREDLRAEDRRHVAPQSRMVRGFAQDHPVIEPAQHLHRRGPLVFR
jgi:hypothetical protein